MVRVAIVSVLPVVLLCRALAAGGNEPEPDAKPPVVLAAKDLDRTVRLKHGDRIELRLPNSMPYSWALTEDLPVLRPQPARLRSQGEGEDGPNASPPRLGGARLSVHRYQVSTDRDVTVRPTWVYCFGSPENTRRREKEGKVPPHQKFSPGLKPGEIKEGMTFHIKLEARP